MFRNRSLALSQSTKEKKPERYIPNALKFAFGGAAGMMATCIVQPLDLLKTRMQLLGKGTSTSFVAKQVLAKEGVSGFYSGLSAGLMRQITYTTTRLGLYTYLYDGYKKKHGGKDPHFLRATMYGIASGGIGAFVGTPAEVALVRMTADGRLPKEQRRNYRNVFDALIRIVREDGVLGLWRGATPTVCRAIAVNAGQLSTYTQARSIYKAFLPEGILLHFCASMTSGLICTIVSLPVDIIKTKIQNAAKGQSQIGVVTNLIKTEGVLALWKGFLPYYARLGPHTVLTFLFLEQINSAYFKYVFYQERPRSTYRKKKRRGACRRALSAAELNPDSIAAANRRMAFQIRSSSTDREESEEENSEKAPLVAQKIDSLAKLLFNKSIIGTGSGKSSPNEPPASPKAGERSMESSAALAICTEYLSQTSRYDLISQLCPIGSRPNKHWFAVHDNSIKTDRLLTLMPLTSKCPIEQTERTRTLITELFRALHHPYIYPVLGLELSSGHAFAVLPFNARGSLKDLIYKSTWNEDYCRKYSSGGCGLPAWQVARFGRQMLEGLLFLKEKGFPPIRHLHTGNVMVQNGVARICGLENTLIGALPRSPIALAAPLESVEALSLGYVLFEMCAGAENDLALLPDLTSNYPHVVEIIEQIFGPRPPTLHELLLCELFRKIDLREMKGSCLPNFSQRLSRSCLSLLGAVSRRQGAASAGPASPARAPRRDQLASAASPTHRRRHLPYEQDLADDWQW